MAAKVLLVEDDRALREALADTLCLGGHDYRAVDCAEAALVALTEEPFGLVVSASTCRVWMVINCWRRSVVVIRNCRYC